MVSSEERRKILQMLEDGKLSAQEAAELINALGKHDRGRSRPADGEGRWLRIEVTDLLSGGKTTTVNLPLSLVHVGLRLGARFVPEFEGVQYQELVEALRQGEMGKIISVFDDAEGKRVEIFVE